MRTRPLSLRFAAVACFVFGVSGAACGGGSKTGVAGVGGTGGSGASTSSSVSASSGSVSSSSASSASSTSASSSGVGGGGGQGGASGCAQVSDCNDGNTCTQDTCEAGICKHAVVLIDDGDACTTDACDPKTGISHTPVPLDDGDSCTVDACDPMTGVSHAPVPVDDGDACTTDACDPIAGVSHVPATLDDGDACTTDACDPMTGISHAPIACADLDTCTADSCDPKVGCVFAPVVACQSNDGCCPAGCTSANDNDCLYFPTGVQTNVPLATLAGWTQCYVDTYANASTSLATILAQCKQAKLLLGCRPTGSPTLALVAAGLAADVTFDTGTGNATHNANGVEWYFNASWSWGFAQGGDTVTRNSCDTQASSINAAGGHGDQRLCWHTGGGNINAGWRCGVADSVFGATYERLIYQAP